MEFELTQKGERICKAYKLRPDELCFADLLAAGWDPTDAYKVAFHKGMTWLKRAVKEEAEKYMEKDGVKSRIAATRGEQSPSAAASAKSQDRKAVVIEAMSKENMLYDLQTALSRMAVGSKEWLDTKKMIVDVTRMKQDEVKDDETTIHHFLPVHYPTGCKDCLYSKCDTCKYKLSYKDD